MVCFLNMVRRRIWEKSGLRSLHRLDFTASGLLLVGRLDGYDHLRRQFEERAVEKQYLVLVHGRLECSGRVEHPIREVRINGEKTAQLGAHPKAKSAIQFFIRLSRIVVSALCAVEFSVVVCIKSAYTWQAWPSSRGDFRYGRRSSYDKLASASVCTHSVLNLNRRGARSQSEFSIHYRKT